MPVCGVNAPSFNRFTPGAEQCLLQSENFLDHARPVGIEIGGHIELVEPTSNGGHLWLQRRLTGRLF